MKPSKPDSELEQAKALDGALRQWTIDNSLPPRFQEEVWRRIERTESRPTLLTLLRSTLPALLRSALLTVQYPKFALSYLAVLLALGVGAGAAAAQLKSSRVDSEMSERYMQSVSPFQTGLSQP
jgi:hypothetical protein